MAVWVGNLVGFVHHPSGSGNLDIPTHLEESRAASGVVSAARTSELDLRLPITCAEPIIGRLAWIWAL